MRDNLICAELAGARFHHPDVMLLNQLPDGAHATVERVVAASAEVDAVVLRRLGELGFIPGEPLQLLRRGPGGREPLAVQVGETIFALRLLEAQCVEVRQG
jgi:ferrous iron transport protein A